MKALQRCDPLPEELPQLFYTRLGSLMRCGDYADRIESFLDHFSRGKYASCPALNIRASRTIFEGCGMWCACLDCSMRRLTALVLCSMMFIDFQEFVNNTEAVVKEVLRFVGVDHTSNQFCPLPPGMKVQTLPSAKGMTGLSTLVVVTLSKSTSDALADGLPGPADAPHSEAAAEGALQGWQP